MIPGQAHGHGTSRRRPDALRGAQAGTARLARIAM